MLKSRPRHWAENAPGGSRGSGVSSFQTNRRSSSIRRHEGPCCEWNWAIRPGLWLGTSSSTSCVQADDERAHHKTNAKAGDDLVDRRWGMRVVTQPLDRDAQL